ncbi:MAG: bifunctional phosphopantothenoylcysteine decarboxylase/phosphopantothenate--cysteine ligase CoaBC [Coleofasciculaceae cyanobacterium SM2_1_6]|nr:bifunctional phosphopantothenoylcysteine decarboxylase/phosphopantothenate--cysteine ligase CoaBC [Coleofasciculaceae cyanobacterium SM2_1_6]
MELKGKKVLVAISGGIAAYKVCGVISQLVQAGASVRSILTGSAREFITPLTITTLCRSPVALDEHFWEPTHQQPLHIQLGEWADLLVIAPLTANTLAKLTTGLADNLLTNTVLASTCPILVVPAMNTDMWEQRTVQRNWQDLCLDKRYHCLEPESGLLACDRTGKGRMAEPEVIYSQIKSLLYTQGQRDLQGKKVLISGGSTREYLDAVRFLGNPATGKMGIALAQAAYHRGAVVTFVAGNIAQELLKALPPVQLITVISAQEMHREMLHYFPTAELTIMAAAVGDLTPARYYPGKLPKEKLEAALELLPVVDIVAELGHSKQAHQKLVGFAAQTGDIITPAQEKLQRKKLDAIVANPVDQPHSGFAGDYNQAVLLDRSSRQLQILPCSKLHLAHHIYDFVRTIKLE